MLGDGHDFFDSVITGQLRVSLGHADACAVTIGELIGWHARCSVPLERTEIEQQASAGESRDDASG